jgi:hypothetical protein
MSARVEHEGDSFLTITLPIFAEAFEKALERGKFDLQDAPGFRGHLSLPRFLGGFLNQVFDRRTGDVLPNPSVEAIRSVRQLTLIFKKVERETSESRKAAAERKYIETEESLEATEEALTTQQRRAFSVAFALLYSNVLNALSERIERLELEPSHGPGSTQDKLLGNRKFDSPLWTERLEMLFPFGYYCSSNWARDLEPEIFLAPEDEPPVQVVFVPKTLKTPRVIAMEPTHMQYVQQGLMRTLVPLLEKSEFGRSQGFSDQEPNRALARKGSLDGSIATIDLSEASDRVLNSLIIGAMSPWPVVNDAVQVSRSTHSRLPSGRVIALRKFASMGSALCFPIEVMAFSAIVLMGLCKAGYTLEQATQLFREGAVRVYGDDIIVPVDSVSFVEDTLEVYGLKVNRSKSFSNGRFRESCGGDYFAGEWVTPIRLRKDLPSTKQHVSEIISINATANQLWYQGYDRAAAYLHSICESILRIYPNVDPQSEVIGRWSFMPTVDRHNTQLQRAEVRGWKLRAPLPPSHAGDRGALYKTLRYRWDDPLHKGHLERAGRPLAYTLKQGWSAVV